MRSGYGFLPITLFSSFVSTAPSYMDAQEELEALHRSSYPAPKHPLASTSELGDDRSAQRTFLDLKISHVELHSAHSDLQGSHTDLKIAHVELQTAHSDLQSTYSTLQNVSALKFRIVTSCGIFRSVLDCVAD